MIVTNEKLRRRIAKKFQNSRTTHQIVSVVRIRGGKAHAKRGFQEGLIHPPDRTHEPLPSSTEQNDVEKPSFWDCAAK